MTNVILRPIYASIGCVFVFIAFVGVFLPGIPTTFPAIVAVYFFTRSYPELNIWIRNNKLFGHLVVQWEEKKIYPLWGKLSMLGMIIISNIFFVKTFPGVFSYVFLIFSIGIVIWSLPYPTTEEEYKLRIKNGEKLGWIN